MARKPTRSPGAAPAVKSIKPVSAPPPIAKAKATIPPPPPAVKKNGAPTNGVANGEAHKPTGRAPKNPAEARAELLARGAENCKGGLTLRSDPLADAKATRLVVDFAQSHAAELSRRGLYAQYAEGALLLAREIEEALVSLPAAATGVRARSPEAAELISDAASLVTPARDAVLRVTRGPDGRRAAHAFGIGEVYSIRQPRHVLRALQRIVSAAGQYPTVAADAGLTGDDLRAMGELAEELSSLAEGASESDEAGKLHEAQLALRAYFDLVAAKSTLAFAGDPEERVRLHALFPRGSERRHLRRAEAPAA